MYCPNCGKKVEGKFCCYCGCRLPSIETEKYRNLQEGPFEENLEKNLEKNLQDMMEESAYPPFTEETPGKTKSAGKPAERFEEEEPEEEWISVREKTAGKKPDDRKKVIYRKKKKGKAKPAGISLAQAADKLSESRIFHSGLLFRIIAFACMAMTAWTLFKEFWQQKNSLGQISQIVSEANAALAVFLLLAVILIGYGVLAAVRILKGKKIKKQGANKKVQVTMRGLSSFVFYFIFTLAARKLVWYLPGEPQLINGVRQAANIFAVQGNAILLFCGLGILCCAASRILRK